MSELQTLNEISKEYFGELISNGEFEKRLKTGAVKWVKEDLERIRLRNNFGDYIWDRPLFIIEEWMKRLNITEEDLKENSNE